MVWVCKEGRTIDEAEYIAVEGEPIYNEQLSDEYKEKVKKMVKIAIQ